MKHNRWTDRVFYEFARYFLIIAAKCFFWIKYEGCENIPKDGPCLLVSNHVSYLDPPLLALGVPRQVCFMARDSLFRHPLKWVIEHLNAYPISRDSGDLAALRLAQGLLKQGKVVVLFPEGTRSSDGRTREFKSGVGMLAARSGAPVVPAYIQGAFNCWPRHKTLPKPGRIRIVYGEPVLPGNYDSTSSRRENFVRITLEIEKRVKNLEKKFIL